MTSQHVQKIHFVTSELSFVTQSRRYVALETGATLIGIIIIFYSYTFYPVSPTKGQIVYSVKESLNTMGYIMEK